MLPIVTPPCAAQLLLAVRCGGAAGDDAAAVLEQEGVQLLECGADCSEVIADITADCVRVSIDGRLVLTAVPEGRHDLCLPRFNQARRLSLCVLQIASGCIFSFRTIFFCATHVPAAASLWPGHSRVHGSRALAEPALALAVWCWVLRAQPPCTLLCRWCRCGPSRRWGPSAMGLGRCWWATAMSPSPLRPHPWRCGALLHSGGTQTVFLLHLRMVLQMPERSEDCIVQCDPGRPTETLAGHAETTLQVSGVTVTAEEGLQLMLSGSKALKKGVTVTAVFSRFVPTAPGDRPPPSRCQPSFSDISY